MIWWGTGVNTFLAIVWDGLFILQDENESSDAEVVAAKSILDQVEPLFE